ncbi:MAG: flavodoxin family protein [Emcibacteraceae bacterium]
MTKRTKILIIDGSYRDDGITDQAVEEMSRALTQLGADAETIMLRDHPIHFCLNCRECMQKPGPSPEPCVQQDAMEMIVRKIEEADGYVLAAPTNLGSITAIFKRFMERLAVYAYWPWGAHGPKFRKEKETRKKAVLITSSAAPGFLARWFYGTTGQLKYTAKIIGADPVGILNSGLIAGHRDKTLPDSTLSKIRSYAEKLVI